MGNLRRTHISTRIALLDRIEAFQGPERRQATEALLENTTRSLSPLFAILPKSGRRGLDAPAAQYALNRYFAQEFGWRVRGLAPPGLMWGAPSLSVLLERMPYFIRQYFRDQLEGDGLQLQDLAVLAATIELLIRDDAIGQLQASYQLLDKSQDEVLSIEDAREVMLLYLWCYIEGQNVSQVPNASWWHEERGWNQDNAVWRATDEWISQITNETEVSAFEWRTVLRSLDKATELFKGYAVQQIEGLKRNLMTLAGSSSGRVSLAEFYGSRFTKGYTAFAERTEYLRQLGVLDESDVSEPRLIIPNYLLNPLNCAGPWSYYATCIPSECDALMSELEQSLGVPEPRAEAIAETVARLPSASVAAPRDLPEALVGKLEEVAGHHGGRVPLHGRLFSQWMHFAYPVECPYPFPASAVIPTMDEKFFVAVGKPPLYSDEELAEVAKAAAKVTSLNCDEDPKKCLAMWNPQEETLV